MGSRNRDDDLESISGNVTIQGEKKEQLNEKAAPGDGLADVSLSPIETF